MRPTRKIWPATISTSRLDARVGVPTTPFTVFAQVGREDGSFYGRKHDWSLGVDYIQGPFTMSLGLFRH